MAGTEVLGRLTWMAATVTEVRDETPRVRSIVFECPGWDGHHAGQHVDIRLTAEDGYQAQRSYSIASAPEDDHLVLTIERLQDGEVSPYLVDVVEPGDQLEMRGPIGGYFIWDGSGEAAAVHDRRGLGRGALSVDAASPFGGWIAGNGPASLLLPLMGGRDLPGRAR